MISAWDIYWVMQLDSIRDGLSGMAFLLGLSAFSALLAAGIHLSEDSSYRNEGKEEARKTFRRKLMRVPFVGLPVAAALLVSSIFLPSTKTAAAMLVIPAVANNETIQKEAGDLYRLAKQALQEAVDSPKEEAKE